MPISANTIKCEYCNNFTEWNAIPITDNAKMTPQFKECFPTVIASCDACKTGVSAKDINLRIIDQFKPDCWRLQPRQNINDTFEEMYNTFMRMHFEQYDFEYFDNLVHQTSLNL